MSEIAKAHTLTLQFKASQRFPSMLKNTLRTLVRSVFDMRIGSMNHVTGILYVLFLKQVCNK
ncbi:hypothetical protein J4480_02325 [Candidatus Woesearchaeota archaeon]|nr:hypothetical protein [Candidatus Woesearchaeota archaeon]